MAFAFIESIGHWKLRDGSELNDLMEIEKPRFWFTEHETGSKQRYYQWNKNETARGGSCSNISNIRYHILGSENLWRERANREDCSAIPTNSP